MLYMNMAGRQRPSQMNKRPANPDFDYGDSSSEEEAGKACVAPHFISTLINFQLKDLMLIRITFLSPRAQLEVVHFLISNESP